MKLEFNLLLPLKHLVYGLIAAALGVGGCGSLYADPIAIATSQFSIELEQSHGVQDKKVISGGQAALLAAQKSSKRFCRAPSRIIFRIDHLG